MCSAMCSLATVNTYKKTENDFDIKCIVLLRKRETEARKTLEGLWIRKRNPTMNKRDECIPITSEFLPFTLLRKE